jgi:hypothetical protein
MIVPELGAIGVRRNNGNGTFGPRVLYDGGSSPEDVALADLDTDGDLDAVVSDFQPPDSGTLNVLRNDGAGNFVLHSTLPMIDSSFTLTVGDVNGDHRLDAVVAYTGPGGVGVFLGFGNGTFMPGVVHPTVRGPWQVILVDLDLDGDLDITTANAGDAFPPSFDSVSVLMNTGGGAFADHVEYRVRKSPRGMVAADVDRDGDADLAVTASTSGTVSILLNKGDGTFPVSPLSDPLNYAIAALAIGEIDGDGVPDLAAVNTASSRFTAFRGVGDGTFGVITNQTTGLTPFDVAIGDLDGGGLGEVVVTEWVDGRVRVRWAGDGGPVQTTVHEAGTTPAGIALSDFDGDGRLDVVVANHFTDEVSVLRNEGDWTLGAPVSYAAGSRPYVMTSADLNGDGHADLAVTSFVAAGGVNVLLGDGAGGFGAPMFVATGTRPWAIDAADIDGDGDLDLAVANRDDGTVALLANRGDGSFTIGGVYETGLVCGDVGLGDVSGDSAIDLVTIEYDGDSGNGNVWLRLGAGDGTFGEAIRYGGGPQPETLVLGDVDGDGMLDAVTGSLFTDIVAMLNQCGSGSAPAPPGLGAFMAPQPGTRRGGRSP